jgi:hypothetical protein
VNWIQTPHAMIKTVPKDVFINPPPREKGSILLTFSGKFWRFYEKM